MKLLDDVVFDSSKKMSTENSGDRTAEGVDVDNSSKVINRIANLYAERLMSDVILVVGDGPTEVEYPSHRLILCANSEVFQIMLMSPGWIESQENRIRLGETSACANCFEDFLKYFYTGKIRMDFIKIIPLVKLADKYNVWDLLKLGLDFMARNVATAAKKHQLITWYQFAKLSAGHNGRKVAQAAENFIKNNFDMVSETLDFASLDLENFQLLLSMSDLVVDDELGLYASLIKWLDCQKEKLVAKGEVDVQLHMERYVQQLLPLIRFPMMTPAQLKCLPKTDHIDEIQLSERVLLSLSYHEGRTKNLTRLDGRLFTPRLYTTEKYCAVLQVDHIDQFKPFTSTSLLYSSQKSSREIPGEQPQDEWVVDVHPKGVWIQKCMTVYMPSGLELPEKVLKTVRVTVSTRSEQELRVRIAVLVVGDQNGHEHVRRVVTRNYTFSENDQIVHFDDVVDYEELNSFKTDSFFLTGPTRNSFKFYIVIVPLSNLSTLSL